MLDLFNDWIRAQCLNEPSVSQAVFAERVAALVQAHLTHRCEKGVKRKSELLLLFVIESP